MARDLLADPKRDVLTVAKTLGVGKSTLYRALQASRSRSTSEALASRATP
jgi:predicted transcriptional regulator